MGSAKSLKLPIDAIVSCYVELTLKQLNYSTLKYRGLTLSVSF